MYHKFLLMMVLFGELGVKEPDPRIQEYLSHSGLKGNYAWCASFGGWALKQAQLPYLKTGLSRRYLSYGHPTKNPEPLDIVVFKRDETKGHLGFFLGYDKNGDIIVLSGNQTNQVKVDIYKKNKLLGFRTIRSN